jgi:hypothetical protein
MVPVFKRSSIRRLLILGKWPLWVLKKTSKNGPYMLGWGSPASSKTISGESHVERGWSLGRGELMSDFSV